MPLPTYLMRGTRVREKMMALMAPITSSFLQGKRGQLKIASEKREAKLTEGTGPEAGKRVLRT